MRKVIFLLIIILSLPTATWAADPIIGTWKTNLEKSSFPAEQKIQYPPSIKEPPDPGAWEI